MGNKHKRSNIDDFNEVMTRMNELYSSEMMDIAGELTSFVCDIIGKKYKLNIKEKQCLIILLTSLLRSFNLAGIITTKDENFRQYLLAASNNLSAHQIDFLRDIVDTEDAY